MRCSLGEDVLVRDPLVSSEELMGKDLVGSQSCGKAEDRVQGEKHRALSEVEGLGKSSQRATLNLRLGSG